METILMYTNTLNDIIISLNIKAWLGTNYLILSRKDSVLKEYITWL